MCFTTSFKILRKEEGRKNLVISIKEVPNSAIDRDSNKTHFFNGENILNLARRVNVKREIIEEKEKIVRDGIEIERTKRRRLARERYIDLVTIFELEKLEDERYGDAADVEFRVSEREVVTDLVSDSIRHNISDLGRELFGSNYCWYYGLLGEKCAAIHFIFSYGSSSLKEGIIEKIATGGEKERGCLYKGVRRLTLKKDERRFEK
jgi:hypothetical protein